MSSTEILLQQRCEMGEKFAAEAQQNAGAVLRKLQAVRNVLTGRVDEAERAEAAVADAPVLADPVPCECGTCSRCQRELCDPDE